MLEQHHGVYVGVIQPDRGTLVRAQHELLGHLLRVMDVGIMTGSEGQRKLTLGNATILAYCLRWPEFRVGCCCSSCSEQRNSADAALQAKTLLA